MRPHLLLALCCAATGLNAQLINGSFENAEGWDASGWTVPCQNAFFGSGQVGAGDWSLALPHGTLNGPCYFSRITQLVPAITDGTEWTLHGWCHNMATGFSDPYIGIGMGIKHADGWWEYFTSAQMNTGNWTYLSVTNTFDLAAGDTAFVICDAGVISGNGGGGWAEFDGLELAGLSTGITNGTVPVLPWWYDARAEEVVIPGGIGPIQLHDAFGRIVAAPWQASGTIGERISITGLASGCYILTQGGRSLRFVKI